MKPGSDAAVIMEDGSIWSTDDPNFEAQKMREHYLMWTDDPAIWKPLRF